MKKTSSRNKTPELLGQIGAGLSMQLAQAGIEQGQVSELSLAFMDWLRAELGGQLVYFPKHRRAEMDERAAELYDRHWQGASIYDLVQEFKLSVPHVYQLLAQERQRRRQERDAQADATHQADRARWRREA